MDSKYFEGTGITVHCDKKIIEVHRYITAQELYDFVQDTWDETEYMGIELPLTVEKVKGEFGFIMLNEWIITGIIPSAEYKVYYYDHGLKVRTADNKMPE